MEAGLSAKRTLRCWKVRALSESKRYRVHGIHFFIEDEEVGEEDGEEPVDIMIEALFEEIDDLRMEASALIVVSGLYPALYPAL